MSKVKVFAVAAFAALAMSAVVAGSASATQDWHVNGTLLAANSSVEIPFQLPKIDQSLILHFTVAGASILILCNSLNLTGRIFGGNRLWLFLLFLKCHTISPTPTNCLLKGQSLGELPTIETTGILGEQKTSTRTSGKPETGKTFAEIPFAEATACALEGKQPVKGEAIIGTPTGGEEREEQAAVGLGSEENNSLEVGSGNKAFLLGKVLVKLSTAGTLWSFR
jgi:hypothetical protein